MLVRLTQYDGLYHCMFIITMGMSFGFLDEMSNHIFKLPLTAMVIAFVVHSMAEIMTILYKVKKQVLAAISLPILMYFGFAYALSLMNVVAEYSVCWFFALCIFLYKGFVKGLFNSLETVQ